MRDLFPGAAVTVQGNCLDARNQAYWLEQFGTGRRDCYCVASVMLSARPGQPAPPEAVPVSIGAAASRVVHGLLAKREG